MLIWRKVLFSFAGGHKDLQSRNNNIPKCRSTEALRIYSEEIDFDSRDFDSVQQRLFGIIRYISIGLDTGFPRNRSTPIINQMSKIRGQLNRRKSADQTSTHRFGFLCIRHDFCRSICRRSNLRWQRSHNLLFHRLIGRNPLKMIVKC